MFTTQNSLRHTLLIAMPQLQDQNFANSVIYICEHNQEGAMGLIINQPTNIPLYDMFQQAENSPAKANLSTEFLHTPLYFGGPVEIECGFILHTFNEHQQQKHAITVTSNIALTSSLELLMTIAAGYGPEKYLVTMGYAGWGAGQLEQEMGSNAWLNCPATPTLIFDTPRKQLLNQACKQIGVTYPLLSHEVGHA